MLPHGLNLKPGPLALTTAGMTLFDAVVAEDAGALRKLAAEAVDINEPFEGGRTALHEAAARGHVELVRLLLIAGADPELHDGDRETALIKAAVNDRHEIVHLLSPLASEDERDYARSILKAQRVPFDPDQYQGREEAVPEWKRTAASAMASLTKLLGDERATERLERVDRSEKSAGLKRR